MSELAQLPWRVMADSSADALEEAKRRAHDEGYRVKGVSRVDFAGPRTWVVRLTVSRKEPMRREPVR